MSRIALAYVVGISFFFAAGVDAQNIAAVASAGDSITKGFNAQSAAPCPNTDQEYYNWSTSDTNLSQDGFPFCYEGPEGVASVTERLECAEQQEVESPDPNQARSGAQMLKDFVNQANAIKTYISTQPAPRLATVLLGHNDLCGGKLTKYNLSCSRGADQDRNNYCRSTPAAFEREFRKGLDILITVPDMKIGVLSIVRVSQLCNFAGKSTCQLFSNCQWLWRTANGFDGLFGSGNGICGSLTFDCSSGRISDTYRMALAYRNILQRVTADYAAIPAGGVSPVVTIAGQTVGGAVKASGSTAVYSDAPWRYKFTVSQLSCCDCFHPSRIGQEALARMATDGLTCSTADQCCVDIGDPVADGRRTNTETSGRYYPGIF
jgi:hypothetical protein